MRGPERRGGLWGYSRSWNVCTWTAPGTLRAEESKTGGTQVCKETETLAPLPSEIRERLLARQRVPVCAPESVKSLMTRLVISPSTPRKLRPTKSSFPVRSKIWSRDPAYDCLTQRFAH